jgi:hypothetical protein
MSFGYGIVERLRPNLTLRAADLWLIEETRSLVRWVNKLFGLLVIFLGIAGGG